MAPPADERNTKQPEAVLTPQEWGVVLPFRWVEIEGWAGEPKAGQIVRQSAFLSAWDDSEAAFGCSDEMMNRIWELCRYSIKATTFAGIYVDGDRERIPYEADAYLNQLSHYGTGNDLQIARDSYDWLMKQPTWPTEWAPHMVLMAHADWMRTGDVKWLKPRYAALKGKTLLDRAGAGGLVTSNKKQMERDDIVDWPAAERDGHVFKATNTVVNAFHLKAMAAMVDLARATGNEADAVKFAGIYQTTLRAFQGELFDASRGLYRDGVGTDHASQHSNLFALAFGLVPEERRPAVTEWLAGKGMACSVYAAQYLLDGLFENEAGEKAVKLITAPGDRSWRHMVESGTTITWEAWDQKYKPNQDWNHAWGAAPANLFPRYIIGVEAVSPGWKNARIRPHTGGLAFAKGKVPTPKGAVFVEWKNDDGGFKISVKLPAGVAGRLELPAAEGSSGVFVGGKAVKAVKVGKRWVVEKDVSGVVVAEVR